MHEAALAQAAIPGPTRILGLLMRPYSIGHELWLIRQQNPLAIGGKVEARHVRQAALVCCDDWRGIMRAHFDPAISLKLAIWKWRTRKSLMQLEESEFQTYRAQGSLVLPCDGAKHSGNPSRIPGAPFLLRLVAFLVKSNFATAQTVWDFPLGLAQMLWANHLEENGALEIYNEHDAKRDEIIAKLEAERIAAEEVQCQA